MPKEQRPQQYIPRSSRIGRHTTMKLTTALIGCGCYIYLHEVGYAPNSDQLAQAVPLIHATSVRTEIVDSHLEDSPMTET